MKTLPVNLIPNLSPNARKKSTGTRSRLPGAQGKPSRAHPGYPKPPTNNLTRQRTPQTRALSTFLLPLLLLLLTSTTAGCATTSTAGNHRSSTGPRIDNTSLTSIDLVRMTDQMAASLIASGIIDTSTPENQLIIVADRVVNRTNQIIDAGEKQLFLTKLRATLNENPSLKKRGIIFVARPDELSQFSEPIPDNTNVKHRGPTHALTAVFNTLTNVDRTERDETYECDFQLQNLKTRKIEWEDAYTVRYVVKRGKVW